MTIIAHVVLPDTTPAEYDAVRKETGWLDEHPDGGLAHLTWWEGTTCHNIDAWEDEAAFNAFAQDRLGPGMAAAGIDRQPQITFHDAHEVFLPSATTRTVS